jgi:hypothetical protein
LNCPSCGTWNNSAFCTSCGQSLLDSSKAQPRQEQSVETKQKKKGYFFYVSLTLALISSIATGSIYAVLSSELDDAISNVNQLTAQAQSQRGTLAAAEIENKKAQDEYLSRLICEISYTSWVCTVVWGSESVLLTKSTLTKAAVDAASATLLALEDSLRKATERRVGIEDNRVLALGVGGVLSGVFVILTFVALFSSRPKRRTVA